MRTLFDLKFSVVYSILILLCTNLSVCNAQTIEDTVEITINKDTTDENITGIVDMLTEYGIEAKIGNIKRNKDNEITGLKIELSNGSSKSSSSFSSNTPIQDLTFGSKNGNLFIGKSKGRGNMFAFFEGGELPIDNDSIFSRMRSFNLKDFIGNDAHFFSFEGDSINIDSLMSRFQKNFKWNSKDSKGNSFFFLNDDNKTNQNAKQFKFIDNPDKETLIVIDGIIKDFKTLDKLANEDKLSNVDVLKPETAMSIYGEKASDGAIIATTKK